MTSDRSSTAQYVCEVCGASTATLRRGRCWICYVRWADARPVGLGAVCVVCNERRRENLRQVEFQGSWLTMCHNCASRTHQLMPVPRTIEGIRQRLSRDRRWSARRGGSRDHRIFAIERRNRDRRQAIRDDDGTLWLDAEDLVIEIVDDSPAEQGEATRITRAEEGKEQRP